MVSAGNLLAETVGLHEFRDLEWRADPVAYACYAASLSVGAEGWCFKPDVAELYSAWDAPDESFRLLDFDVTDAAPVAALLSSWPVLWKPASLAAVPQVPERSAAENALTIGPASCALRL